MIKKQLEAMKDVRGCHQVSVRMTGKRLDVSAHVLVDSSLRFEEVHRIVSDIEREVRKSVQRVARITVQTEPVGHNSHELGEIVKDIAESVPGSRGVHNIHIQKIAGKLCVDLHLEVRANMTVKQAHDVSDQIDKKLRSELGISEITIHIEDASDLIAREELRGDATELKWYVEHAVKRFPEIKTVHGVRIRRVGDKTHLAFSCHFDPSITVKHAHEVSDKFQSMIRSAYPDVERIDIHEEPA
jgi:divalent metal cation (Fe/Co/Zn/Cd) transporter